MFDRAKILNNTDLPRTTVDVPGWGGVVHIRSLTAGERDQYELMTKRDKEAGILSRVRSRLIVLTVVDEEGNNLFLPGDIDTISALPAAPVDAVFMVAARFSGLFSSDVEELVGNSEAVPSANGSSA